MDTATHRTEWLNIACLLGRRWIDQERTRKPRGSALRPMLGALAEAVSLKPSPPRAPRDQLARAAFSRTLGGVYLAAFTSLRRQVLGLYGQRGILPVSDLLQHLESAGPERYRVFPTLLWLDHSDRALVRLCKAGQLASLALIFDVAPRTSAFTAWAAYLSLVSVGQDFLSFQWDSLLLEAGVLAIAAAPTSAVRWLVFRLYFESGSAKLQSGDPTWRKLTANRYHFETQPLPTRLGWYAHHLPRWAHRASTAAALVLETGVPFLALGPKPTRRLAFALLTGLQAGFALTGNFGYFNLLAQSLGFSLLDDEALQSIVPPRRRPSRAGLALPLLALSGAELAGRFSRGRALLKKLGVATDALQTFDQLAWPLRPVGSYGLFAVMTLKRPEVIIEGSRDGVRWKEYGFRYKPGDLSRPPSTMAPHMPRLDWQMWFAALGTPPRWFSAFMLRLLEGAPEVLALLSENPFADAPPQFVRARLFDYRMTSLEERRRTGNWWRRELLGPYFPSVSLGPDRVIDGPATRPTLFA